MFAKWISGEKYFVSHNLLMTQTKDIMVTREMEEKVLFSFEYNFLKQIQIGILDSYTLILYCYSSASNIFKSKILNL